jgi:hypothetical protein
MSLRSLLLISSTSLVALSAADSTAWAVSHGQSQMHASVVVSMPIDSNVKIAGADQEWDDALRVELSYLFLLPEENGFIPYGEGYLYYEDRTWSEGASQLDYDSLGAGIGGGGIYNFFKTKGVALGVAPFARIGLGSQDGRVTGLSVSDYTAEGNGGDWRGELGVGADATLGLGKRFMLRAGVSWQYWQGESYILKYTDSNDDVEYRSDSLDGTDVMARLGAGITF